MNSYNFTKSICSHCANCVGKCSWSAHFKPVKGWTAEKVEYNAQGLNRNAYSYNVTQCPQFEEEERAKKKIDKSVSQTINRLMRKRNYWKQRAYEESKRYKYTGDIFQKLIGIGFDIETATTFLNEIKDADVVEVVRCKDCEYYEPKNSIGTQGICNCGEMEMNYGGKFYPFANDFCSYGTPKERGADK